MKNIITIVLLIATLYSCGYPTKITSGTRQYDSTDPTFASYIDAFERANLEHLGSSISIASKDIPINFGIPEEDKWMGACIRYGSGKREIIIRKSKWDGLRALDRRQLIFHELGHCALNKVHDNEIVGGYHTSLMSEKSIYYSEYLKNQYALEYELFSSNKSAILAQIAGI